MIEKNKDILYLLKWFNNPDNHKGTDTVTWIPRRILAEAISEIANLRDELREKNQEISSINWVD